MGPTNLKLLNINHGDICCERDNCNLDSCTLENYLCLTAQTTSTLSYLDDDYFSHHRATSLVSDAPKTTAQSVAKQAAGQTHQHTYAALPEPASLKAQALPQAQLRNADFESVLDLLKNQLSYREL